MSIRFTLCKALIDRGLRDSVKKSDGKVYSVAMVVR